MSVKSGDRGEFTIPSNPQTNAYVKIIEQPASKAIRFRYESESKSHRGGVVPGIHSSPSNKTFPAIQIMNYIGPAAVVVSCVTKEKPYRAHPHRLIGKDRKANKGIYTLEMNDGIMTAILSDLTIQYVKVNDIGKSLNERAQIKVDPFNSGFDHASDPSSIDMKSVRLCFQVFLKSSDEDKYNIRLAPIVSEPVHNKMCDLKIVKLSKPSCSVSGGEDIILLCEKVAKDDIKIRFFEKKNGVIVWEDFGYFQQTDVHKGVAISFRTPKYKTRDIEKSLKCFIQLYKPSDGSTSDALPFEYFPLHSNRRSLSDKVKSLGMNRMKNRIGNSCSASTDDDRMQQKIKSSLRGTAIESILNFCSDMPSTSVTPSVAPTQVEHQPQFDNADYIGMISFHDTNLSNQMKDLSHQKLPPMSIPPSKPISDNSQQTYFQPIHHVPMEPHLGANFPNQQQQLNIPSAALLDAIVNFMSNNPNQNHQNGQNNVNELFLDQANQIDNGVKTANDDVIVDSFSSMSISSGPILDSQFAVEMCSDFIKHLDNNGGETIVTINNQSCMPNCNEQIMNICQNGEFINCGKSEMTMATENIVDETQWNYMTPCNTII